MAETNPPLPKSGGSGPIIIAAILMLLLIGGLIVWKVTGSSDAPKPQASVATTPPPASPQLDEPPPPPPPPPTPEESAKPDDTGPKKAGNGVNPCAKVCEGTPSATLQSALSGRASQSRSCYEKALSTNSTLEGTLTVGVKVGLGGTVCGARIVNDGLHDPGVANCVINRFMTSSFPAPQGGCVEVNVPLRFMPKR